MRHGHDDEDAFLTELVDNDPWRSEYEKGRSAWPESPRKHAQAREKRGPVRLTLRIPRHVYEQAKRSATRDGMSLNTFLVGAVAKEIGDELGYRRGRGTDS